MKRFGPIFLLLFSPIAVQAGAPTVKEARERLLRGNYAEARELFTALAKDAKNKVSASIGLSRAHESEGQYEQALSVIDAVLKDAPQNPELLARRAEILYLRGRWEEADKDASAALAKDGENFLAHWIKGQVLRDKGEVEKADEEFRWFVRTYTNRSNMDKDITDPEQLVWVGLAGCERARRHNLSEQFKFILNEVYKEAVKQDKSFWPAEYQAGRLLMEKYNKAGAHKAFERALAINLQAAEVYAAKGQAALSRLEIKDAAVMAEQALKINPRLTEALRLQADLYLFGGEMDKAMKELEKAQSVNPREETTLARVGACLHVLHRDADFAALVKKVHAVNLRPAIFYYELAERLDERKLFDEAEKYYQLSIKSNPKIPWAHNGLGLLAMRLGREDEARKILEPAFKADKFNVRVYNTLTVLDHLEKYTTLKTEHFHLRYDPKNDKVLAKVMAKYLEDIYKELAEKFQYRPNGPILIEVFNNHEMFSGRIVALPDLHTIGACTGKMVAMVSPHDKSKVIAKPFNWNRVLRHELVHIFNLEQTKYMVPHWFTEGLAVQNEGTPMPPRWHTILAERVASGELMNLDNILLGFARPNSAEEWHLAYLQSLLYVEYLIETYRQPAVGKLLEAYAAGLDTAGGIQKVCKVSKAEFEKGYRAFLQERVKKSGIKLPGKGRTFKELKAAHEKDQNDPDIAAQLAEHYLRVGDKKNARNLADAVLIVKKTHPLAAYVKASLLLAGGQPDEALSLLQGAVDAKTAEPKVLRLLGKLQLEGKKYSDAAGTFELGRKLEPHETMWLIGLARIYKQNEDKAKLIDVLKALVPTDADDLPTRRELAKMLLEAGKAADAERYAWQALEIDVLDRVAQETLENALMSQNKEKELKQVRELLEK
jgi:tetratricopeptide (TPR) repeat protein